MLFASITEFGAVSAGYRKVLDDLQERQGRLDILLEADRLMVATLGSTDLVEILLFDSFFPLSEVGGSGAQAFRRAIGVWCPQPEQGDLPVPLLGRAVRAGALAEISAIQDVMTADPARPFLGVIYTRISPMARLCMPTEQHEGGQLLIRAVLERFLNPESAIWGPDLEAYMAAAAGTDTMPPDQPRLRVAPLGGLDSVDLVFLVRAARLEQVGAMAWALRKQTLSAVWPGADNPEALRNARALVGGEPEPVPAKVWDQSPLFCNTSSILGVPIRSRERKPKDWHLVGSYPPVHPGPFWFLEAPKGSLQPAAEEMALLVRYRFTPGSFRTLGEELPGALGGSDGKGSLLQLFGQRDALAYNRHILQEPRQIQPVDRYTVDDLLSFMSSLTGATALQPPAGVSSTTEIALVVRDPGHLRVRMPDNLLIDAFQERLNAVRDFHLQRSAQEYPGPWVGTWLQGAKVAGLPYPVTNGVLNLICSVLDYLDEDIENFGDLLRPLQLLVDWSDAYRRQAGVDRLPPGAGLDDHTISSWTQSIWSQLRDQPLPSQLRSAASFSRFYENLEQLATFRGRRDHPMRAPHGTLAFEGHAGYRVARDAFATYVRSLSAEFGTELNQEPGRILVLDSSTGRPTCTADSSGTAAVQVSAMAVHHPIHWVFGHEIAHAQFSHIRVDRRPDVFRAAHYLVQEAGLNRALLRGSIEQVFSEVGNSLWDEFAADEGSPFCRAVADVLSEVPADLLEWRTLKTEEDEGPRADRRFWFSTGPGLVHGLRDIYGRAPIGLRRVRRLIIRVFFTSRFIEGRMGPGSWRGDLQDLCEWMYLNRDAMSAHKRLEPLGRMADRELIERLRCLKEDLDIPDEHWSAAVVNLVLDRSITAAEGDRDFDQFSRVQRVVDAWIPLVNALMDLAPEPATLGSARALYAAYLDDLLAQEAWSTCTPWPQFIVGHPNERAFASPDSRRHSRRRRTYNTPAISQRGGVMIASPTWRRAYHELTLRCMLSLEDLSRAQRREVLSEYLELGERGIVSGGGEPPSLH